MPTADEVRAAVQRADWYQTIELPHGVVTPGEYDLRPVARRLPIPASLAGKRCLDVGTRDGFWAFELERRGAEEVIGIDLDDERELDWPQPQPPLEAVQDVLAARSLTFETAKAALDSRVQRRNLSVYRLSSDAVGEFDFAIIGTLLLHLRDPIGALMAIRRVLRPGGRLLVNEVVSASWTVLRPRSPMASLMTLGAPFWWIPNRKGLERYVTAAGFQIEASGGPYLLPNGPGYSHYAAANARRPLQALRRLMFRKGAPHAWVLAEPRP